MIPLFLDTWALMRSQYWHREEIDHLQNERVRGLIKDAARIPFWKDTVSVVRSHEGISVRELLSQIPITTKGELIKAGVERVTDPPLLHKSDPDNTSGSTGKPLHFYQDWYASLRSFAVTERIFRTTGKRYPIVYMRSRQRSGFTFYRHIWFFVFGYNSIRHRIDDFKELGRRLRGGFILYGYTSWVVELARQMEKNNLSLPIRAVMVAGEHLTDADRAYVERIMGVELFTLYASRETGFLGYECEYHQMHVSEEWAYLEIVDEEGRPLPFGHEGRIIVTTFDNRVMPFIRYEIGDVGALSDSPCACGRTLRTLTFRGRTTELIELEDNRVVSLLDIAYKLGLYPDTVRQYQIVQTSTISFVVRVVPGQHFDANKEALEALMVRLLHPRVEILWEILDMIPESKSGKAAYFVRDMRQ